MKSIAKLKDQARKHEQKEDWKAAIEAYQKVLETEQGEAELELELGLFNRIGDLYLRLGETDNAVSYYEQAADKYAEAGFFNNAIALCNKALRHRPNRAQIYLKLSRLSAEQGFTTDARRWILDYAARQVKAGRVDTALDGLRDFVDSSADPDVREFLAQQLATQGREKEAAAQFARAYAERKARGETEAAGKAAERARALDPSIDLSAAADAGRGAALAGGGDDDGIAGLETRPGGIDGAELEVEDLEGLEPAGGAPAGLEDEVEGEELAGFEVSYSERKPEATADELDEPDSLGGLETFGTVDAGEELGQADEDAGVGPGIDDDDMEPLPLIEDEAEPLPMLSVDGADEDLDEIGDFAEPVEVEEIGGGEDLEEVEDVWEPEGVEAEAEEPPEEAEPFPGLDFGAEFSSEEAGRAGASPDIEPLDLGTLDLGFGGSEEPPPVESGFVDVDAVLGRARELVGRNLTSEALRELSLLSGSEAGGDVFRAALAVVNEILRRDPNDLTGLQRRVEFAARTEDRAVMVTAYLDLAAALDRTGAEAKARAMYERALDLDPRNADALEALGSAAEPVEENAVDLDAILREMGPGSEGAPRGPVPDEGADPEFAAMLSQFKARVTEHVDAEDAGDHYDLGLAFKEMGLIDEAIAEFQTALTGGEERLKVYEELGQCFVLKNQPNLALKIFSRALQVPHEDPAELLGVYYHLGQCHEELGQREQARDAYQKVLAIDPSFEDVPDRMARL